MQAKHWAVLLVTATMLASSFFFNKVAVGTVPPVTIAAARALLAVPVVLLFVRLSGNRLPPLGRRWGPLLLLGLLTAALPHVAIAWSQVHIDSGLAGILYGTIPLLTVIYAHFATADEKWTASGGAGVLLGLGGIVIVLGPAALAGLADQLVGSAIALSAALCYAVGGVYSRRFGDMRPVVLTAAQYLWSAAILVPLSIAIDAPWTLAPSSEALWSIGAVAVIGTALPGVLIFWLVQRVGATNTSMIAFFMPVIAVFLGTTLLGESLSWQASAGLVLILVGMAAVGRRPPTR